MISTFDTTELEQGKSFDTPMGKRFVDLYNAENKIAFEVKSGRITHRKFIQRQIAKDKYLLENSLRINRVIWMLFEGASLPTLRALNNAGLEIMNTQDDTDIPPNYPVRSSR